MSIIIQPQSQSRSPSPPFIGIIGGSGLYRMESIQVIEELDIETPFGRPSAPVVRARWEDVGFYFIPRHGREHTYLPHEVNYRANIYALKQLGAKYTFSVSAVGSLKEECPPGSFVLPDQFLDWGKGKRARTFFGEGIVAHVPLADPVNLRMQEVLFTACKENDFPCHKGGAYLCIEGPQLSTKAESRFYRSIGATVIGMTNVPEAYLAKEAGMAYATLAMVTDYDCWRGESSSVGDILKVMKGNTQKSEIVLKKAIKDIGHNPFEYPRENQSSLLTPLESLQGRQREIVQTLLR